MNNGISTGSKHSSTRLVSHRDFLTSTSRNLIELAFRPVQEGGGSHEIFFAVIIPFKHDLTRLFAAHQRTVEG
jgi:hypothetical protein